MKIEFLFAALVLSSLLGAQSNEDVKAQSDAVRNATPDNSLMPRQLFEKGAYAEEHERDFEKAAKLYGEAARRADSFGDTALAGEAKTALKRIEARLGKGTDTKASGQDVPIAVQRRLFLLVKQLSSPKEGEHQMEQKNYEAMNQLTPFGAVAVPMLERALNSETIEDPDDAQASNKKSSEGGFRGSTHWAARTLAAMEAPEAAAALLRGLRSPDPFVRTTVVSNAYRARHRALLDEAVKDPALVGLAIMRLSYVKDADLGDLMKSGVYRDDQGGPAAMKWLVRNRRDEALAAAKSGKIRFEALRAGIEEIIGDEPANGRGLPRSTVEIESKLPVLLEIGEALEEPSHVLILIDQVNRLLNSVSQIDPALKARLEAIALRTLPAAIKENSSSTIMALLANIGGLPTARALLAAAKGPVAYSDASYESIRRIVSRAPSAQFLEAAEIVRTIVARAEKARLPQTVNDFYTQLRMPANGASADDLIAGYKSAPEDQRFAYVDNVFFQGQKSPVSAIVTLLEIGEDWARRKAVDWLGGNGAGEVALAAIVKALSDPSENVRGGARGAFTNVSQREQKLAAALVSAAAKEHQSDPSPQLVAALAQVPVKESFPILKGLWTSAPERRGVIAERLLEMKGDEVSAFLVENFDALSDYLRSRAVDRFGASVYEPAIDVIGSQLASRDENVRMRAQTALEVFKKQREAVEEFKRWKTGSAESRASIGELMKLLESTNRDVVIGAVKALGAVRAQSALPALVKLLERNDSAIKGAVEEAIKKIGE
jgi:HEAT repeat protein